MRLIAFATDSGAITRILATFALSEPLPEYEFDQRGELVGAVPLQTILLVKVT